MSDDGQLLDKHELAQRWRISTSKVKTLRRKDLPAEQSQPKLLFDPQKVDRWARKNDIQNVDVPPAGKLGIEELAARFDVSPRAVRKWRKKGCPVLEERGLKNSLRFDPKEVETWLASEGIVPGTPGVEGGRAANNKTPPADKGSLAAPDTEEIELDGEPGLEQEVQRLRNIAQQQGVNLSQAFSQGAGENTKQARLKTHMEIVDALRKAEKDLVKVQKKRENVVQRDVYEQDLDGLARICEQAVGTLPGELSANLVQELQKEGVTDVGDKGFMRVLRRLLEKRAQDVMRRLSQKVNEAAP